MILTVIICTHNPRPEYLAATLGSIQAQKGLDHDLTWELLIIDNASTVPLATTLDLRDCPQARICREERVGLTFARLQGFAQARGEIILFVDDDNVLDENYFANVIDILQSNKDIGAVGGKSLPVYEIDPPAWFDASGISLACRDLGDDPLAAAWADPSDPSRNYPLCAPIGAGMAVRRIAYEDYVRGAERDPRRTALGRRGTDLASGEDNDMIMSVLEQGWQVAYRPELSLKHLIPATRLTQPYLERYARSTTRTWVEVLNIHGICPWTPIAPWTLPLRRLRALMVFKPWTSPVARLRWQAALGQYEGRASIIE